MENPMYLLSLPEILGVFWMKVQGAEWAKAGFTTAYLNKIPQEPLYRDEYEEDYGPKISSKFPLFSFYKEAGLAYKTKHWGSSVQIYCEDWDKFQRWVTVYLQAYQDGKLAPNGNFLNAEKSEAEIKALLEQYKELIGTHFTLEKSCCIGEEVLRVPPEARVWEELLWLEQAGAVKLTLPQDEFTHNIEWLEWLDVDVELLQEMIVALSGSVFYLGIRITKNDLVYFGTKEIKKIKRSSNEFKLLKYLVEHKGEPVDRNVVFKLLKYSNDVKEYQTEYRELYGNKKSKDLSLEESKAQRLRGLIQRIREKLGKNAPTITSSKKEGVALKPLIKS